MNWLQRIIVLVWGICISLFIYFTPKYYIEKIFHPDGMLSYYSDKKVYVSGLIINSEYEFVYEWNKIYPLLLISTIIFLVLFIVFKTKRKSN